MGVRWLFLSFCFLESSTIGSEVNTRKLRCKALRTDQLDHVGGLGWNSCSLMLMLMLMLIAHGWIPPRFEKLRTTAAVSVHTRHTPCSMGWAAAEGGCRKMVASLSHRHSLSLRSVLTFGYGGRSRYDKHDSLYRILRRPLPASASPSPSPKDSP